MFPGAMQLYLVRHGIAKEIGVPGVENDADRPLSADGVASTQMAARGFARLHRHLDRIVSSPLLRALQTAEIFAGVLQMREPVETCNALATDSDTDGIIQWLREQPVGDLMLVGHMPSLSLLVSRLIYGNHDMATIHFRKSGICRLSLDGAVLPGTAALEWLIPPSVLRCLEEA
jgi:phosphohistidine phosphatase